MSERLTIVVDDDVPSLLLELAGSSRKQGEYISTLVRAAYANGGIPAVSDLDTLAMQVQGLIAGFKQQRAGLQAVHEALQLGSNTTMVDLIKKLDSRVDYLSDTILILLPPCPVCGHEGPCDWAQLEDIPVLYCNMCDAERPIPISMR